MGLVGTAQSATTTTNRGQTRSAQEQCHARIALFHRAAVSGTGADAREIFDDVRAAREIVRLEVAHGGERKADHDIGGGELVSCEILRLARPRVDMIEGEVDPSPGGREDRIVVGELEPVQDKQTAYIRLKRTVGEMKPVQELRKVGIGGVECQPSF